MKIIKTLTKPTIIENALHCTLTSEEVNYINTLDVVQCIITKPTKKRSLNANAYLWVLCEQIAIKLNTDKESIYKIMLARYGAFYTISIKTDCLQLALQDIPYYKILGTSKLNDTDFTHLQIYVGSHSYNPEQMHRLLNGVVQEAKDLNIQTIPQNQIDTLAKSCGIK